MRNLQIHSLFMSPENTIHVFGAEIHRQHLFDPTFVSSLLHMDGKHETVQTNTQDSQKIIRLCSNKYTHMYTYIFEKCILFGYMIFDEHVCNSLHTSTRTFWPWGDELRKTCCLASRTSRVSCGLMVQCQKCYRCLGWMGKCNEYAYGFATVARLPRPKQFRWIPSGAPQNWIERCFQWCPN